MRGETPSAEPCRLWRGGSCGRSRRRNRRGHTVYSNDGDAGLTRFAGKGRRDVVVVVVDAASGEDGEERDEQEGARDGHARVAFWVLAYTSESKVWKLLGIEH